MTDLKENIEQSLELLFKVEKQPSKKKLLIDEAKTIYLQIGLFGIPFVPSPMKKYLRLRHSLYGNEPEVCLFVPNRKTGVEYKKSTDELIDFCIDYYTELLEKHKIKGISTIMPLKQLRSEYGTFELKRKLVRRYDLFLCKNSLLYNPRFLTALGKFFKNGSREPLGVVFPKKDSDFDPEFQKSIDRAIFASSFVIKQASDNYTIPIGTLSNTKSELKENLETVLDQLISENMIPGGVQNVRFLNLWPSQSKPIPLFVNPELPPKAKRPRVKTYGNRKLPAPVEGEISTQPGKKVVVMPHGEVFVTKLPRKIRDNKKPKIEVESESEDSFRDGSEEEEEDEEKQRKNVKSKLMIQKDEDKSDSEDDEEIEKREERLLRAKRKAEWESEEDWEDEEEEKEKEESIEEELQIPPKKKAEKAKKRENVKKSNRKMLMKQEKFKAKKKKKSEPKKI